MRTYIRIPGLSDKESSEIVTELTPLCDKILESEREISCYPVRGNIVEVIRWLIKKNIHYEIKTDFESGENP